MLIPNYNNSDGHRTRFGDWLVCRLPALSVWPGSSLRVDFGRAIVSNGVARMDVIRRVTLVHTNKWGFRSLGLYFQTKPWGGRKRLFDVFGLIYVGRA